MQNKSLTVLTALVLSACFAMTAALFISLKNFNNLLMTWGKDLQMTVYLKENTNDSEIEKLLATIKSRPSVQQVRKVSVDENFERFKAQMGSLLPQIENQSEIKALVPTTLQIVFDLKNALVEPLKIFAEAADSLKTEAAVEQVSYGQLWVEKFSKLFLLVRQSFWFVALVLMLASVFVFSNAIRAWVNASRFEIEVLELVGATPWSIRKPFLIRGAQLGLVTGSLGLVMVVVTVDYLKRFMASQDMFRGLAARVEAFTALEALFFLLFATGLGVMASYLCVREINSGWAAAESRR